MKFTSSARSISLLVFTLLESTSFALASAAPQNSDDSTLVPSLIQNDKTNGKGSAEYSDPSLGQSTDPNGDIAAQHTAPSTDLSSIKLPEHGGGLELPEPPSGLTLKATALGSGEQIYMCQGGRKKPKAYGAQADLYDASPALTASTDSATTDTITSGVLTNPEQAKQEFSIIGRHYFDSQGAPAFDLGDSGFFRGVKLHNIPAPPEAAQGSNERGAVDWVMLSDKGDSRAYKVVYRVATAGGQPPMTCRRREQFLQVPYAALYFFYG